MQFYAVAVGKVPGIYTTWEECQSQVTKFPSAKYKKFQTELEAKDFVKKFNKSDHRTPATGFTNTSSVTRTAQPTSPPLCEQTMNSLLRKIRQSVEQVQYCTSTFRANLNPASSLSNSNFNDEPLRKRQRFTDSSTSITNTLSQIQQHLDPLKYLVSHLESTISGALNSANITSDSETHNVQNRVENRSSSDTTPSPDSAVVYTDGGCINIGTTSARAGIGVYWGPDHPWNVSKRCPGRQTNNNAEIRAATEAIKKAEMEGIKNLVLRTDSKFTIKCVTTWMGKWKRNGWKLASGKDVQNTEELMILDNLLQKSRVKITWEHVRGHVGIEGNEGADKLASAGVHKSYV